MKKRRCILSVDVEALSIRANDHHVDTLIYGRTNNKEFGIGYMMDIADKHNIKMTFFVDFAECELYGDKILEVGRYILSRGHDMQVHCHYDLLHNIVGKPAWVNVGENYYNWYKNDEDSKKIIDYVTDRYIECCNKKPIAYRGGEYRFGISILKALKEKGYIVDSSYNCIRPESLPVNKQFKYENELIEFPLGILTNKKPLNFNYQPLVPDSKEQFNDKINEYKKMFDDYYTYYGGDAIASLLMHSWSFMHEAEHFKVTNHMDCPNPLLGEFFDYFLENLKEEYEFVSLKQALESVDKEKLKKVDFQSIFSENSTIFKRKLVGVNNFIKEKAGDRQVVIWGKGIIEILAFQTINFHKELRTSYYISKDAEKRRMWRNKPVYTFEEVELSPEKYYVFVLAKPEHQDIRETLQTIGFKEYEDYYDIEKEVPVKSVNGIKTKENYCCSICGGNEFETFNSDKPRRCSNCGSVERTRTLPKVIEENLKIDFSNLKVLHVSPSKAERMYLKKLGINVTTLDIRPECKVDIVDDLCNMTQVQNESFDAVLANCVLNHVYDDKKALGEIKRILKKEGIALLWVLDSGSYTTVAHEDPTGWYGKENYEKYRIGTYRHYGENDFVALLEQYFSKVNCYEKYDEITDAGSKWYVCRK